MLFRIENVNDVDANLRTYCPEDFLCVSVDKAVIDEFIASMIRQEINGAKNRSIWSYSKSLAACILKYNKNADNELHIFDEGINLDSILYVDSDGKLQRDFYSLRERLYWGHKRPFFADGGKITLRNFVIDVSDNDLVDEYLRLYTGKGRKKIASPEKDSEVAVMNPSNDLTIIQYLSTVYTLYALQYRYRFLCCDNARINLIRKIQRLDDFRFFVVCYKETTAFGALTDRAVPYLIANGERPTQINMIIADCLFIHSIQTALRKLLLSILSAHQMGLTSPLSATMTVLCIMHRMKSAYSISQIWALPLQ